MNQKLPTIHFKNIRNHLGFEIQTLEYIYNHEQIEDYKKFHLIEFYIVILITEGYGEHLINFKSYSYKKGSLLFVAKSQVHAFVPNTSAKGYIIFFDENFLNQNQITFNDLSYSYPFNFGLYDRILQIEEHQKSVFSLFDYLYLEYQLPLNSNTEEILQCLLRALLLKTKSSNTNNDSIIESSKSSITQEFIKFQQLLNQNIQIRNANFYCDKLHISYDRLNSITKKLTGKTIKNYIDKNLEIKAKQLLTTGSSNISEIAFKLGFKETTNFTKFFKRQSKMSPSKFIKSVKKD